MSIIDAAAAAPCHGFATTPLYLSPADVPRASARAFIVVHALLPPRHAAATALPPLKLVFVTMFAFFRATSAPMSEAA